MKKNKHITIILVTLLLIFGLCNLYIKLNEVNEGVRIVGATEGISIDINSGFSQEEVDYVTKVCLAKRDKGLNIDSFATINLGKPTHTMHMNIFNKSDFISSKSFEYKLWLGTSSYIQEVGKNKIYKLDNEEHHFFKYAYSRF